MRSRKIQLLGAGALPPRGPRRARRRSVVQGRARRRGEFPLRGSLADDRDAIDGALQAWARDFAAAMAPYATGVYVNNLGVEGADRVRAAYAPATFERLVALKDAYDPQNVLRLNQNIVPTRA